MRQFANYQPSRSPSPVLIKAIAVTPTQGKYFKQFRCISPSLMNQQPQRLQQVYKPQSPTTLQISSRLRSNKENFNSIQTKQQSNNKYPTPKFEESITKNTFITTENDLNIRFCESDEHESFLQKLQNIHIPIKENCDDDVIIDSGKKEPDMPQSHLKKSIAIQAFESTQFQNQKQKESHYDKIDQLLHSNKKIKIILKKTCQTQKTENDVSLRIETLKTINNLSNIDYISEPLVTETNNDYEILSQRGRIMTEDLDSVRGYIPTPKQFKKKTSFLLYKNQLERQYK